MTDEAQPATGGDRKEARRKLEYAGKDLARARAQFMQLTEWYSGAYPDWAARFMGMVEATEQLEAVTEQLRGAL